MAYECIYKARQKNQIDLPSTHRSNTGDQALNPPLSSNPAARYSKASGGRHDPHARRFPTVITIGP